MTMADLPSSSSTTPDSAPPAEPATPPKNLLYRVFIGPQGLRAGWRLLVFVGLFLAATGLLRVVMVYILHLPRPTAITPSVQMAGDAGLFACALSAAWVMSLIERRPVGIYGLPASRAFGRNFWAGSLWGAVTVTVLVLAIRAAHGLTFDGMALTSHEAFRYGAFWLVGFIIVGLAEEFLTRGYAQFTLASGIGFWPAAVLLSAFFGAGHLANPGEGWIGAASAAMIGLWLALTLRRTGDLWFAVGFHAWFDYGQTFVYSVPNSGLMFQGHLLHTTLAGPRWLTGGSVGPEASLFNFILMGLLFVLFDRIYHNRQSATTSLSGGRMTPS